MSALSRAWPVFLASFDALAIEGADVTVEDWSIAYGQYRQLRRLGVRFDPWFRACMEAMNRTAVGKNDDGDRDDADAWLDLLNEGEGVASKEWSGGPIMQTSETMPAVKQYCISRASRQDILKRIYRARARTDRWHRLQTGEVIAVFADELWPVLVPITDAWQAEHESIYGREPTLNLIDAQSSRVAAKRRDCDPAVRAPVPFQPGPGGCDLHHEADGAMSDMHGCHESGVIDW
jgi:hypothetical protein